MRGIIFNSFFLSFVCPIKGTSFGSIRGTSSSTINGTSSLSGTSSIMGTSAAKIILLAWASGFKSFRKPALNIFVETVFVPLFAMVNALDNIQPDKVLNRSDNFAVACVTTGLELRNADNVRFLVEPVSFSDYKNNIDPAMNSLYDYINYIKNAH